MEETPDIEPKNNVYYNELAIASLTLGIISFLQLFGLERSITAVVFGFLALKRIKQDGAQKGKKMAIAGIILGCIWTIVAVAMIPQALEVIKSIVDNKIKL